MKKRRLAQSVVIFIVILVPVLYVVMFLYAYWNPTANMTNVPVAVVNCDQGGTVNGDTKNIGKDLVDSLKSSNKVKWVFTDKKDADKGVISQKYYAALIIPENFTKNISSASDKTKTQGILYFKSNDKLGMMASSLLSSVSGNIETTVSRSISQSIVDNLTNKLQALPSSMQKLSDGLARLNDGSSQLQQGMLAVSEGQTAFNGGLDKLMTGMGTVNQGGNKLKSTLQLLTDNSILFANGIDGSVAGSQTISDYSGKYKNGLSIITDNLNKYLDSSGKQLQNSISIVSFIKKYIDEHPECIDDANIKSIIKALGVSDSRQSDTVSPSEISANLGNALTNLNEMYAKIDKGIQQVSGGMKTATNGARTLSNALGRASGGSLSLSSGLNSATNGANSLYEKSKSILAGEQKINSGLKQLNSAIELMKSSVDSSLAQLTENASLVQGIGQFVAQPVRIESTKVGEAENTGTALTPFMISLCLYIGGFMIIITVFSMENIKFKETDLTRKLKTDLGLFRYQLIGVAQAVLIAFAVHVMLGLDIQSAAQFYGICILGSLAFTTIAQLLIILFKSFGKILCLIFMMCQITAGGGVIPFELLPSFYKSIHPYMPMKYTIDALRNVILGIEPVSYHHSITVLICMTVISALFVILLSFLEHRKEEKQKSHTEPLAV